MPEQSIITLKILIGVLLPLNIRQAVYPIIYKKVYAKEVRKEWR